MGQGGGGGGGGGGQLPRSQTEVGEGLGAKNPNRAHRAQF
jgi:hypothetical protein